MTKIGGRQSPETMIMLVFLIFETLLFSLFCMIILGTQINAIWTDSTYIENLKKEGRRGKSGFKNLKLVLGDNIAIWLSPFTQAPAKKKSSLDNNFPEGQQNSECLTAVYAI